MVKFSQNKKIAISAIALFVVSFTTMTFFLGGGSSGHGSANVMSSGGSEHGGGGESANEATVTKTGFSTDVSGNITMASKDFCKLLDKNCEEIIKQPIYKYVNKEDFSELAEVLGKESIAAMTIDSIGPIKISADQGEEKMIILSAQSVKDKEGKITVINFSVKDITDKVDGKPAVEEKPAATQESEELWKDSIYPKIKDVNEQGNKLLVKLSFNSK
jgi:PAS domain S-box-containing protein